MQIIDYGAASLGSPYRGIMQDTYAVAQRGDGVHYFGVFDGHGPDGMEVAEAVSSAMLQSAAEITYAQEEAQARMMRMTASLKKLHANLAQNRDQLPVGGSTATVAVVKNSILSVGYLGDSEAIYYPNDYGEMIRLTKPHNVHNADEVRRITNAGHEVDGNYFCGSNGGGRLAVSRAIGDWHKPDYMSQEADVSVLDLNQQRPGTLVIASDGVWGNGMYDQVQSFISLGYSASALAKGLVEEFGPITQDDATAIVVKFQSNQYERDQVSSKRTLD